MIRKQKVIPKVESKKDAQRLVAAHVFVHKSRDGMVIAQTTNILPYTLYKLSRSPKWEQYLQWWGYNGNSEIKGELYHKKIGEKKALNSLKQAGQLWQELLGFKPIKRLTFFLRD